MSRTSGRSAAIGFTAGFALGGVLRLCGLGRRPPIRAVSAAGRTTVLAVAWK